MEFHSAKNRGRPQGKEESFYSSWTANDRIRMWNIFKCWLEAL